MVTILISHATCLKWRVYQSIFIKISPSVSQFANWETLLIFPKKKYYLFYKFIAQLLRLLLKERCDDASRCNNSLPYKTPAKFTTHLHRKRAWSEKNSPWPYFMLTQWTQALILLSADAPMYIPRSCSKTNFVMTGEDMLEGLDCQTLLDSWRWRRGSKITFICS